MIVVAATEWSAVAAEIADDVTGRLLASAFRSLEHREDSQVDAPIVARVSKGSDGYVDVTTAAGIVTRSAGMAAALDVATEFNRELLDRCMHFAVHAAVLSTRGGTLALPAESGTGKSTLAAACLRQGFGYVSDEALVVTLDGAVLPYPRPLALSRWSRTAVGITENPRSGATSKHCVDGEELVSPLQLGQVVFSPAAADVRAVIRMRRRSGDPLLTRLPRSQGATELLRNSFNHYRDPAGAVALVHRVAERAESFDLGLDDPSAAAELLASHFGVRESDSWIHRPC